MVYKRPCGTQIPTLYLLETTSYFAHSQGSICLLISQRLRTQNDLGPDKHTGRASFPSHGLGLGKQFMIPSSLLSLVLDFAFTNLKDLSRAA